MKVCVKGVVLEDPVLRPEQSRMARAALQWSLEEAAEAASVSRRTVLRFERDHRDIKPDLIQAIRRAFEDAGVRFIEEADLVGLVAPRSPPRR
jgi:transcriptional regulator with XRE-family HTH domain